MGRQVCLTMPAQRLMRRYLTAEKVGVTVPNPYS